MPRRPRIIKTNAVGHLEWPFRRNNQKRNQRTPPLQKIQRGERNGEDPGKIPAGKISLLSPARFCPPFLLPCTARSRLSGRKHASRGLASRSIFAPISSETPSPAQGIRVKYGSSMSLNVCFPASRKTIVSPVIRSITSLGRVEQLSRIKS